MHDNADYGKSRIVATDYGRGYAAGYRKALSDAQAAIEAAPRMDMLLRGAFGDDAMDAAGDALAVVGRLAEDDS